MSELMNELRVDGNMNTLARKSCFFFVFSKIASLTLRFFFWETAGMRGDYWRLQSV